VLGRAFAAKSAFLDIFLRVIPYPARISHHNRHYKAAYQSACKKSDNGLNAESLDAAAGTDSRIEFDGNKYTVPSWLRGKTVTAKADNDVLSVYYKGKRVATHPRSWEKKKVIEDPKHIKSILKGKHKALRTRQEEIFFSLGETAEKFVEGLAKNGLFLEKSIAKLLDLKDVYGKTSLLKAIDTAMEYGAYGVDYVENILYQQRRPEHPYPKVILKNEELSNLRLHELDLKEYDALIMAKRHEQESEQEKEDHNEQNGEHRGKT